MGLTLHMRNDRHDALREHGMDRPNDVRLRDEHVVLDGVEVWIDCAFRFQRNRCHRLNFPDAISSSAEKELEDFQVG